MVTEVSERLLRLVGGVVALALALAAFARHIDFFPTVFLLQTGGSFLLASLGSQEKWQQRIGIALAVNAPLFLYVFIRPS